MPNSKGQLQGSRNKLSNDPRERGMSPPQRAVERFDEGEKVHLRLDPSVADGRFHPRFNGQTGEIAGEQGSAYKVRIVDGGKEKILIVTAAHLTRQPRTDE
ncbi:50S ribosomal protein L21e [Halobacteriales archaeon QS_3_64_16]|nr:MAG: 50S ribosomal protein L21e [Halobacteriales archaeon QS_3_64_16]